jgi:hypothetical protein
MLTSYCVLCNGMADLACLVCMKCNVSVLLLQAKQTHGCSLCLLRDSGSEIQLASAFGHGCQADGCDAMHKLVARFWWICTSSTSSNSCTLHIAFCVYGAVGRWVHACVQWLQANMDPVLQKLIKVLQACCTDALQGLVTFRHRNCCCLGCFPAQVHISGRRHAVAAVQAGHTLLNRHHFEFETLQGQHVARSVLVYNFG